MVFAADRPTLEQFDRTLFRTPPLPPKCEGSITSLVALAEQGDPRAQCWVGLHYTFGTGVKQDVTQAVHWLDKSANQGFAPAEYSLSFFYKHGLGVSFNSAAATEEAYEKGLLASIWQDCPSRAAAGWRISPYGQFRWQGSSTTRFLQPDRGVRSGRGRAATTGTGSCVRWIPGGRAGFDQVELAESQGSTGNLGRDLDGLNF